MHRIQPLVPLIGATVTGPLGVAHLPRMWLKGTLSAAGMLPPEYFDNYKGFNKVVVDGVGLEPEAWFAFLGTMPTYPQAEDYVRKHAAKLDEASIAATNEHVLTYRRPPESAAATRARVGIDDDTFANSALLLNYDDWFTIHQELLRYRGEGIESLVPMISSSQAGMLGIPHVPRLWFKASLNAVKALREGWKTGLTCGFDSNCAKTIGLDLAAAVAYIEAEFPGYVQFERWAAAQIGPVDDATKAAWSTKLTSGQKPEDQAAAECVEAGTPGAGLRSTVMLNDLVDWKHMHDDLAARQPARA